MHARTQSVLRCTTAVRSGKCGTPNSRYFFRARHYFTANIIKQAFMIHLVSPVYLREDSRVLWHQLFHLFSLPLTLFLKKKILLTLFFWVVFCPNQRTSSFFKISIKPSAKHAGSFLFFLVFLSLCVLTSHFTQCVLHRINEPDF